MTICYRLEISNIYYLLSDIIRNGSSWDLLKQSLNCSCSLTGRVIEISQLLWVSFCLLASSPWWSKQPWHHGAHRSSRGFSIVGSFKSSFLRLSSSAVNLLVLQYSYPQGISQFCSGKRKKCVVALCSHALCHKVPYFCWCNTQKQKRTIRLDIFL